MLPRLLVHSLLPEGRVAATDAAGRFRIAMPAAAVACDVTVVPEHGPPPAPVRIELHAGKELPKLELRAPGR